MSSELPSSFDSSKRKLQSEIYSSSDKHYNIINMFIHPCRSLNQCMKKSNRCDVKTDSEHNPTQSRACSCTDLPCLISIDIIFHLICILHNIKIFFF